MACHGHHPLWVLVIGYTWIYIYIYQITSNCCTVVLQLPPEKVVGVGFGRLTTF